MKTIQLYIFLLGLLGLAACVDDTFVNRSSVKEGIPCQVSLSFAPEESEIIMTKSSEDNIRDLYILVFDAASGARISGEYYPSNQLTEATNGKITVNTTSGNRKICAVANLTTNSLVIEKTTLDNVQSLTEFQNQLLELEEQSINSLDGRFLMSGFYGAKDATEAPTCIIDENGTLSSDSESSEAKVWLKKLQSVLTFNITTDGLATSFVLDSFSIYNIPERVVLGESGTSEEVTYFNKTAIKDFNEGGNSFSFYILENKKSTSGLTSYDARESYDANGRANAPEKSTYVVLNGKYKGKAYRDGKSGEMYDVDAIVKYNIHLGYVGNDPNNFECLRNKNYIYSVSVEGVNKIVLEVVDPSQEYDRGDGDVYFPTGNNIIDVDAHYARTVLKFSRGMLKTNYPTDIKVLVNSNKTTGFEKKDLNWVSFIQNAKGYQNEAACYPGTGSSLLLTTENLISQLEAFRDEEQPSDVSNEDWSAETLSYTCFINEYYDTDNNWKEYVNQNDRIMQILCNTQSGNGSNVIDAAYIIRQKSIRTFYNVDKVSTAWGIEWINETTNTREVSGKTLEIGLEYGDPSTKGSDNYNGRWNMIREIGSSASWYARGGNTPNQSSTPVYQDYRDYLKKAYAACMQRNRDENGDGVITEDEIKWYLPAIYQYTDISIGTAVLPQDAQLYSSDDYKFSYSSGSKNYWLFKHYVSNSNKQVFWAEESGPYGSFGTNGDGTITKGISSSSRQLRCVRNLGLNSNKTGTTVNDKPEDFASFNSSVIDLTKMNAAALRSTSDFLSSGELRRHDERSILSRPYTKFQVATDIATQTKMDETVVYKHVGQGNGNYSHCENGYYYAGKGNGAYLKITDEEAQSERSSNTNYYYAGQGAGNYEKIELSGGIAVGSYTYYEVGAGKGDYSVSTTYEDKGADRYFNVPDGKGSYVIIKASDCEANNGYFYYNTGIGKEGQYRKKNGGFTDNGIWKVLWTDYSSNTYIRYSASEFPLFRERNNGNYVKRSQTTDQYFYSVSENQGNYIRVSGTATAYFRYVGTNRGAWTTSQGYYAVNMSDVRGNWNSCDGGGYHEVGEGNGAYIQKKESTPSGTSVNSCGWASQNQQADKDLTSVCSEYTEAPDGSDKGSWRLPNLRELLLIDSRTEFAGDLMSRTYYSFYLNDIINNGKTQKADGTLSGYTIYSPANDQSREGFAFSSLVFLINPGNATYHVRCVKDVK